MSFPKLKLARLLNTAALVFAAGSCVVLAGTSVAVAQEVSAELQARMAKEKEARSACKAEICKAFAKPGDGSPITCTVTKTWLGSEIQLRFLGDKLSWPWGHAQCSTNVEVDRKAVGDVAKAGNGTLKLKKHDINCSLDAKDAKDGTAYTVKMSIEPAVTFENGQAKKADMGWGPIDAPVLAKTAIWSATAVDSNFSVISSGVVKEINEFFYSDLGCKAVGVEIAKK